MNTFVEQCFGHYTEVAFIGAVLFIHKSTLAWCKFRLKKSLSIVVLLLGNSLLHNGYLVNSIEHACVLITLIPTDYTCITHLQTELLLHACKSRFYDIKGSRSVTEISQVWYHPLSELRDNYKVKQLKQILHFAHT